MRERKDKEKQMMRLNERKKDTEKELKEQKEIENLREMEGDIEGEGVRERERKRENQRGLAITFQKIFIENIKKFNNYFQITF